ncbi:MAG: recombinase family protein [Oscillospiraceae bacterium]|nr:recombinase family protein [Oscillospiraceae bacterium]
MTTLRIAAFMRGSTNKQTSKGKAKKAYQSKKVSIRETTADDDLPLQKEMIRQFVDSQPEKNKNIEWVMTDLEYVEAGVSGFHTHVSKRKGLNQAFDDAKAGLYDILVIYKLDRFGRRSVESLNHALKFLRFCRIWVVDKNREFTNNGDADEILNFVEFWSAKKSSMDTKVRVTDAMRLIHEEGYWTGGNPPYGYINHPDLSNMLQAVPQEAEIVKQIYHMYTVDGYGMLRIASILNEEGKKSKIGKDWSSASIRKILNNTIYKGYLSYGKTVTTEGEFGSYQKPLKAGEGSVSERYWSEYDLVGEDVWEKAQAIKKSRVKTDTLFGGKTPARTGTGKGLLVGVLKCECGCNMTFGTSSNWLDHKRTKKGPPYGIYRCLKRLKMGTAVCGAVKGQYKSADLEAVVIQTIKKYMQNLVTSDVVRDIQKKSEQADADVAAGLKASRREIERLTRAKEKANTELMKILTGEDSAFSQEQLKELYEQTVIGLDKVTRVYTDLKAAEKSKAFDEQDIVRLQGLIKDWDNIFDNASGEVRRQMIAAVVNEVRLKDKDIDVEIAFDYISFSHSLNFQKA